MDKLSQIETRIREKRFELDLSASNPLESAKLCIDIGRAFRERAAITNDVADYTSATENLNKSIAMLEGLDQRALIGKAHYYLGIVKMNVAKLDAKSMAEAIRSFNDALRYIEKDLKPFNWSMAKFQLGNAWYFNHEGNYL